jgi:hypothetical protein
VPQHYLFCLGAVYAVDYVITLSKLINVLCRAPERSEGMHDYTVCPILIPYYATSFISIFILQQKRPGFPRLRRPFSKAGRLPPRVSCSAPFRSSISWLPSPSFSFQRGRRTCHGGIFVFLCLAARSWCTQTETLPLFGSCLVRNGLCHHSLASLAMFCAEHPSEARGCASRRRSPV